MSAMRIRLLEPSNGAVTGGARLLIHGKGFRPAPHSLVVRFKLLVPDMPPSAAAAVTSSSSATTASAQPSTQPALLLPVRVDVAGKFVMESQLECVVPSFQPAATQLISQLTRIPATSATVLCSPLLLSVQVEVILDSDVVSNALHFALHQPIVVQKLTPQYVLLAPPTTMTATLNLLRLTSQSALYPRATSTNAAASQDITSLPVYVRVRQVSTRTGAVSEQTRTGRWKVSPIGVYEVEFDATMLGYGAASVDVTLNRLTYFRGRDKVSESLMYHVQHDVTLDVLEPCCISVTSGRMTEVRLLGQGFVDSGDLVVQLAQRAMPVASLTDDSIKSKDDDNNDAAPGPWLPIAQLNATFVSPSELRCSVQPNMPFGLTTFTVSLNGGRQFGHAQVVALLHRDRALESIAPACGSLDGHALVTIRHACLALEDVDAPRQVLALVPPKRLRVRFQAINDDGSLSDTLVKVVVAEPRPPMTGADASERGLIHCRTPPFLDDVRTHSGAGSSSPVKSDRDGDVVLRIKRFRVSVALGGDAFVGALDFGYYFPPVIRSVSMHHGPITGGTSVCLRMKFKVPPRLRILVRFQSLATPSVSEVVEGVVATDIARSPQPSSPRKNTVGVPSDAASQSSPPESDAAFLIYCTTPAWTQTPHDLPHLTKVQVSYNGGIEFVPVDDPVVSLVSPRNASGAPPGALPSARGGLVKDLSYLYFLFYRPPQLRAISPMSADIHGGSYLRIFGDYVVDHGAPIAVVFQSPHMSRQVAGFIEHGELRCCAPPFNVGLAAIYVSLNGEQFTKCVFVDPETLAPIDFVFYSSPSLRSISPLCACVSTSSVVRIAGVNLIETGRIKVRFSFTSHHGKVVSKDVGGRAVHGVITAPSPLFASDFADRHATVDVALNGYDFSGTTVSLYYFAVYTVKRVEPATGAFEIPIPITLHVTPQIFSDAVHVRVRFRHKRSDVEPTTFGPVDVKTWTASRMELELPALATYIESLDALASAQIDVSFDATYFHCIGELLTLYRVYTIPFLTSMSPLFGPHDRPTEVLARGVNLRESDVVTISLFVAPETTRAVATAVARVQQKRQALTWQCPALDDLVANARSAAALDDHMLLPASLTMQISCIDGQQKALPFVFRAYKAPRLLRMTPAVGYICSGSLISFEFAVPIETPTVDFRFGASEVTGGRIRDERFVECFSPELTEGVHDVAVSFNEQHYDIAYIDASDSDSRTRATFQAFALPLFTAPANRDKLYAFGPMTGGTIVHIRGEGFIAEAKIYVRFTSPFKSGFGDDVSEVVVSARVLDPETIQCVAPASHKLGRVQLHVSYNLQQFTDAMGFFEYHATTRFASRGILCGPVSGGTPVTLVVLDASGLPEDQSLVACVVRFQSDKSGAHEDVAATFDPTELMIASVAPAWPLNELVSMHIALARGSTAQFGDSKVKFLFYDPPKGVIDIEPSAGPVTGGTEVLAWCGKIVDTGEITVSITMYNDGELPIGQAPSSGVALRDSETSASDTVVAASKPMTLLVKGKIVGDAVAFTTPSVPHACVAYLNISLNGINYTSVQTAKSSLRYIYYVEPVLRRIAPAWSPLESVGQLMITGEHIRNYGCKALVRFQLQNPDDRSCVTVKVVDACFPDARAGDDALATAAAASSTLLSAIECSVQAIPPGCYEIEVSLNGQQFSTSNYMSAKYGNYAGTACTALLPFRCFATPFFLATPTGPAAGGSAVTLYMAKKLAKMLAKETKCQVQFTPQRASDAAAIVSANQKPSTGLDPIYALGEIDHVSGKISCRAPLLRSACAATLDVVLPLSQETKTATTSACAFFNVKDRERYFAYESPAITEIAPSCGPTSGGTTLVIEATNVLDTGQIFVRFRSSLNDREFVMLPATYSRTFPDGSLSCSPLILCKTPPVEIVDKVMTVELGNGNSGANGHGAATATTPRHKDALTGRARAQTFQQLAEQSVRLQQRQPGTASRVLKVTRMLPRPSAKANSATAPADAAASTVHVLVDFTLNAGEQFIAHSVTFHYYVEADAREIAWSPRHLPTRSLDRLPLETRQISVQLPKTYRLSDAPERICFRFEGAPQPIFWKRRGASVVLHETGVPRELLMVDVPKFKTQSTMRRRSTYFRNSSISASSNNILSSSGGGGGGNVLPTNVKARPPPSRGGSDADARKASSNSAPAPYVAGKVVRGSELTCPIPDFSCAGVVRVFLSLNAQQFVCLGDLHIHNPVSIKEDDKYRFCSNIGGDPFMLNCSPSTIFSYLTPPCVTNEAQYSERMFDLAHVKASRALAPVVDSSSKSDSNGSEASDATATAGIYAPTASVTATLKASNARGRSSNTLATGMNAAGPPRPPPLLSQISHRSSRLKSLIVSAAWREREFHVVQVHLVPPQPRLLRKVVVSVSRVDSQIEIGTSVPDDSGCCVFEMTDWGSEMLLRATPPPSAGYASYSAIICEGVAYRQKHARLATAASDDQPVRKDSVTTGLACGSHILMVQHAPKTMLQVVTFSPSAIERTTVSLVACDSDGNVVSGVVVPVVAPAAIGDATALESDSLELSSVFVDPEQLDASQKAFYVCVQVSSPHERSDGSANTDTVEPHDASAPSHLSPRTIQVALSDHTGVQLFLSGLVHEQRGWWIVARVSFELETNALAVTSTDRLVPSLDDITTWPSSHDAAPNGDAIDSGDVAGPETTQDVPNALAQRVVPLASRSVTVSIWFSCADSSRNLSCVSEARLILPGAIDLATFMSAPLLLQEVKLECAMPELPFSGPTVLMVTFGATIFSNSICIQCYDPRTWRITSLDPPCGLVHSDVALRVEGENFVENRKILVRLSDATRYVNVTGAVEKLHLLILRVAAIKHLRALLQSLGLPCFNGQATGAAQTPSSTSSSGAAASGQKQHDDASALPLASVSNFTLTLRIECGKQTEFATCREASVLAVLSSASVLSWEEHFELQVFAKHHRVVLTLEISDASLAKPIEIARAVASLDALQDGVMARKTFGFEEHFRRGRALNTSGSSSAPASEIDLLLHLSPPMLNANVVACTLPPLQTPQKLRVQISSGDSFYSTCEELRNASTAIRGYSSWYQVYALPSVVETSPKVLPRSAGGEITIHGTGFIDCDGAPIVVRLFACAQHVFTGAEERAALEAINSVTRLERQSAAFFVRDVHATFVSSTQLTCVLPPHLATYNVFYRVSFDGREFTEATAASHVLLFSIDAITPRGGPVSGNTYTALHGTNISACMARWELVPTVRLKWVRGTRELESVTVAGEYYHGEDVVYFYSPQSKFGLANITAHVELCLCTRRELESASVATASAAQTTAASASTSPLPLVPLRFGQDEIPFVLYKAPTIKVIAPTLGLVCGLSSLELLVQGLDERAAQSLKHVHKTRFKRRGQMQLADATLVSDGKFVSVVPRFNVSSAVATVLPADVTIVALPHAPATSPQRSHGTHSGNSGAGGNVHRPLASSSSGPLKIWTRDAGLYVSLLRARHLHVSKKHTCNAFAVVTCNNRVRLKSTRKDGTFAPVWNELFDFEWRDTTAAPQLRVVIENQLTVDQSEIVGSVDIRFAALAAAATASPGSTAPFAQAFALRAWFPLRKKLGRNATASDDANVLAHHKGGGHHLHPLHSQSHASSALPALGDVELAICFVPAPAPVAKNALTTSKFSSIMSVLTTKKLEKQQQTPHALDDVLHKKKEKILSRLFRHQTNSVAHASMVPSELLVELALNGQDFWSVAPHRCYLVPPAIVVNVEPAFISIAGGTQLHVFGMNFVPSAVLRVAFAFADASVSNAATTVLKALAPSRSQRPSIDPSRVIVVDAKYRSSTCLTCVTPPLESIAPRGALDVTMYVSTNGVDFESISLPQQLVSVHGGASSESDSRVEEDVTSNSSPRKRADESAAAIVGDKDGYVVHYDKLATVQRTRAGAAATVSKLVCDAAPPSQLTLTHRVPLYWVPTILGVKPSDGIYTSRLTIEGRDFTRTSIAVGRNNRVLALLSLLGSLLF